MSHSYYVSMSNANNPSLHNCKIRCNTYADARNLMTEMEMTAWDNYVEGEKVEIHLYLYNKTYTETVYVYLKD